MPCILVVGLVGNFAFLITVVNVKTMKTDTNFYLINLALADTCFLAIAIGDKFFKYMMVGVPSYGNWFGTAGCVIIYSGAFISFFASLFLVTVVSFERYYAICKPFKHRASWHSKYTFMLIAACWITAIMLTCTLLPGFVPITYTCIIWPQEEQYLDFPVKVGNCSFVGFDVNNFNNTNIGTMVYTNLAQTIPFFFAMTTNTIFYIKIIHHMKKCAGNTSPTRTNSTKNLNRNSIKVRERLQKQVARMLVITGVVFFVCQAPYQFMCLSYVVQNLLHIEPIDAVHANLSEIVLWSCRLLLYVNSAVNPYIYNATNSRYRDALLTLAPCESIRRIRARIPSSRRNTNTTNEGQPQEEHAM